LSRLPPYSSSSCQTNYNLNGYFQYRLSHCVGRSSQATTAAVEKSGLSLTHRIQDTLVAVAQRETLGFNARLAVGSHPGIALIFNGIFDGTEIQGVVKTP
jgi:hypothetical protein